MLLIRPFLLVLLVAAFNMTVLAQEAPHACGHAAYATTWNQRLHRQQQQLDAAVARATAQGSLRTSSLPTIPIVVHVIHQGGPENISAAQVQNAIAQLNEAFANTGAYAQASGVNTDIRFCLAVQDPNGSFTSGIDRINSPLTNMTIETDDPALKALSVWDPTRYLNIWVVASVTSLSGGAGIAGYSTLPSAHGAATDGIVLEAGTFGTGVHDTKVAVHEVGHYLGLYHTFEGSCGNADCLLDGDQVCDTPPDGSSAPSPCASPANTCTTDSQDPSSQNPFRPVALGGLGDQDDPTWDYMDYSYQNCQNRFTAGQATRMAGFLTGTRASLGLSMGCQTPCPNPATAAFLPSGSTTLNVGGSLSFFNNSSGANAYTWTVNGQVFSTAASPSYTFSQAGSFVVQLVATNGGAGCADSTAVLVTVNCPLQANFSLSTTTIQPGDAVTFTQQSPGSLSYTWLRDGIQVQTGPQYTGTFPNPGGSMVCLVTDNGSCRDTACQYVPVGDCGQKRAHIWMFGQFSNGLNFNSGVPVQMISSITNAFESSATICKANGQLELYTNGYRVYRPFGMSAGMVITNGDSIWGGPSSTHAGLFVPHPGEDSVYYLFAVDQQAGRSDIVPSYGGISYNVIDLRGGSVGAVVQKNVPLYTPTTEKIAGVRHANGCDVWVMTHAFDKDSTDFRAYRVTSAGLDTVPVISKVGFPHCRGRIPTFPSFAFGNTIGQMKFSPDGTKLAVVIHDTLVIEVFDFDKSTGKVSNPFHYDVVGRFPYGVEFSPDGSKLYYTTFMDCEVFQLNLQAGSHAAIAASNTLVFSKQPDQYNVCGAISRAPDGKLYIMGGQILNLHTIHNPNALGTACNATLAGPALNQNGYAGLTTTIADYSAPLAPQAHGPVQVCAGDVAVPYYFDQYSCSDSVVWRLPAGVQLHGQNNGGISVNFPLSGSYSLIAEAYSACGRARDTLVVTVQPFTQPHLGTDRIICPGSPVVLNPGGGYSSYLWDNGATTPTRTVSQPGTYSVTVGAGACVRSDTVVLLAPVPVSPQLGPDASICPGAVRTLSPGAGFASYLWQDFSTNASYTAWQPGTYWVEVTDGCGAVGHDTLVLAPDNGFQVSLGPDTVVCQGSSILLDAGAGQGSYLWSNGATTSSISIGAPGSYWVEVVQPSGCYDRDTVEVELCVGLYGGLSDLAVTLYPNPAMEELYARFSRAVDGTVVLQVYDALGRVVWVQVSEGAEGRDVRIPLGALAQGVYQVQVRAEGRTHAGKVLKR